LKYQPHELFDEALIQLIDQNRFEVDTVKQQIKFSIQRPLLRQVFEYEVRKLGGVSDGSFSKQVVTIKQDRFAKLLTRLYGDKIADAKLTEVQKRLNKKGAVLGNERADLFSLFAEEFVKSSGGKTAELLFDSLSPAAWLKDLMS